jgi:hypothetical protein
MLNSGFRDQGFGGEVVISADKNIAKRPHQVLAFKDNGLICFFMQRTWASQDMTFKCAHLMCWWMRIMPQLKAMRPRDCHWVPMTWCDGPLKEVVLPDALDPKTRRQRSAV